MREKCSHRLAVASAPTGAPGAVTSCSVVVKTSDPVVQRPLRWGNRSDTPLRRRTPSARPAGYHPPSRLRPGAGRRSVEGRMTSRGQFVLDDVSRAIIEQLQEDGRRPYARIATAVGLS